jgi:hypothetical protein
MSQARPAADLSEIPPLADVIKDPRTRHLGNETQWRWRIFNRTHNGLTDSGAIVKRSGRWYVVLPRLRDWLLEGEAV